MSSRFLVEATMAPATQQRYKQAVLQFLEWCADHNYDATSSHDLDELLTEYFHDLYEQNDGSGKGLAAHTYYGLVKYLPRVSDHLPTALLSLKGWLKLRPAVSYPPLTWDLTVLVACQMVRSSAIRCAIGTLLAFDCFLRVGELVNLRRSDVAFTGDLRLGAEYQGTALRLRSTKTGPNQWVHVHDPNVAALLAVLVQSASGGDQARLINVSADQYRRVFKQACASLGLSSSYVPHSLRHGGATRWHLLGHTIEDILLRGRWASTKSARRYVQAGRAMLLATHIPNEIGAVAAVLTQNVILSLILSLSQ
jgi:integrase